MKDKNKDKLLSLITAIDWSGSKEFPKDIYVLVSTKESNIPKLIKNFEARHWRELSKKEKSAYLKRFLKEWEAIKNLLYKVDNDVNLNSLLNRNRDLIEKSKLTIVDDSIFGKVKKELSQGKFLKESHARSFKIIVQLADTIANVIRKLLAGKKDVKSY